MQYWFEVPTLKLERRDKNFLMTFAYDLSLADAAALKRLINWMRTQTYCMTNDSLKAEFMVALGSDNNGLARVPACCQRIIQALLLLNRYVPF